MRIKQLRQKQKLSKKVNRKSFCFCKNRLGQTLVCIAKIHVALFVIEPLPHSTQFIHRKCSEVCNITKYIQNVPSNDDIDEKPPFLGSISFVNDDFHISPTKQCPTFFSKETSITTGIIDDCIIRNRPSFEKQLHRNCLATEKLQQFTVFLRTCTVCIWYVFPQISAKDQRTIYQISSYIPRLAD